jgi:hypothetical protein
MEHPLSHVFVLLLNAEHAIAKASQVNLHSRNSSHLQRLISSWQQKYMVSNHICFAELLYPRVSLLIPSVPSNTPITLEKRATDARSRRPPHRRALPSGASSHLEGLRGMPKAQDQVHRPVAHAVRLLSSEAIALRLPFSSPHSPARQCIAPSSQCHLSSPTQ